MSDWSDYLAQTGELPQDVVLGHLVLYTISNELISEDDLAKWFDTLALNPRMLPPPLNASDAFRKATSEVDKFEYILPDGLTATILIRSVKVDKEVIVRHMVREIRNAKRQRLSFNTVAVLKFFKAARRNHKTQAGSERILMTIETPDLVPGERATIQELVDKIDELYVLYADHHDGDKLRSTVRNYLLYLNAIEVKSGTYFVHSTRTTELQKLSTLVSRFGGACQMHLIPIVALDGMRDMVVEAYRRESQEEMNTLVKDMLRIRGERKGKLSLSMWAKFRQRYDEAIAKAEEHRRILRVTADLTGDATELAIETLEQFQEEMFQE